MEIPDLFNGLPDDRTYTPGFAPANSHRVCDLLNSTSETEAETLCLTRLKQGGQQTTQWVSQLLDTMPKDLAEVICFRKLTQLGWEYRIVDKGNIAHTHRGGLAIGQQQKTIDRDVRFDRLTDAGIETTKLIALVRGAPSEETLDEWRRCGLHLKGGVWYRKTNHPHEEDRVWVPFEQVRG